MARNLLVIESLPSITRRNHASVFCYNDGLWFDHSSVSVFLLCFSILSYFISAIDGMHNSSSELPFQTN
ncbi:unnamed protein product [Arabidopsis halleri]